VSEFATVYWPMAQYILPFFATTVLNRSLDGGIKPSKARASTTPQVGHLIRAVDLLEPAKAFNIPVPNALTSAELKADRNVNINCSTHRAEGKLFSR
jgi:hypothetical protein